MTDTAPARRRTPQAGPPLPAPAAAALALSVAAGVAFAAGPRPDTGAGAVLDYLRDHDARTRLVAFLVLATALPITVFGATVYRRLRRLGVTAPGSVVALAGGVLAAGSLVLSGIATWAAGHGADALEPGLARALVDIAFAAGGVGVTAPLALLLGGVAVPCLVLRLAPRPLALAGLVLAATGAVSTLALLSPALYPLLPVVRFGGLAWLVVVGFALPATRHARPGTPA